MLTLEFADRLGAGAHPGRRDRLKERSGDRVIQSLAAERLAWMLGAVVMKRAHARVGGRAAVAARIGDLHPPPATPAAHNPLEQRQALARGTAPLAARPHVLTQPLAGGQVLLPTDIPGMVLWQADGPLLDR